MRGYYLPGLINHLLHKLILSSRVFLRPEKLYREDLPPGRHAFHSKANEWGIASVAPGYPAFSSQPGSSFAITKPQADTGREQEGRRKTGNEIQFRYRPFCPLQKYHHRPSLRRNENRLTDAVGQVEVTEAIRCPMGTDIKLIWNINKTIV